MRRKNKDNGKGEGGRTRIMERRRRKNKDYGKGGEGRKRIMEREEKEEQG